MLLTLIWAQTHKLCSFMCSSRTDHHPADGWFLSQSLAPLFCCLILQGSQTDGWSHTWTLGARPDGKWEQRAPLAMLWHQRTQEDVLPWRFLETQKHDCNFRQIRSWWKFLWDHSEIKLQLCSIWRRVHLIKLRKASKAKVPAALPPRHYPSRVQSRTRNPEWREQ